VVGAAALVVLGVSRLASSLARSRSAA
jgi:hypothetical protein